MAKYAPPNATIIVQSAAWNLLRTYSHNRFPWRWLWFQCKLSVSLLPNLIGWRLFPNWMASRDDWRYGDTDGVQVAAVEWEGKAGREEQQ